MTTYKIVRFYQDDKPAKVITRGQTLEQAQAHCSREDTHGPGWFDGFTEDDAYRRAGGRAVRVAAQALALAEGGFVCTDGGRAEAGFLGDAGDCVTRALTIAACEDYRVVYDELNYIADNLPLRGATKRRAEAVKTKPSSRTGHHRKVYERWLADRGWQWTPTMGIGTGTTVHLRPDELPSGRLVVRLFKHLCAVIDGIVYDTYDPSREGTRCVYGYWSQP